VNLQIIDTKLKKLIQICKETCNYKKLAVVSFILTSNLLDVIGVKLGLRARNKEKNERLYDYMEKINGVVENNVRSTLFKSSLLEIIRQVEPIFLKMKGDISLEFIQQMFYLYYDLRKLDIPNVYEGLQLDDVYQTPHLKLFSFLSRQNSRKNQDENKIKPLLLYKIQEQERTIQQQLSKQFDKDSFKQILSLKALKKSLNDKTGKITIKGALKENLNYMNSVENIVKYAIIGCMLTFLLIGSIILVEMIFYPNLTFNISPILLVCFFSSLFFILLYRNYQKRE